MARAHARPGGQVQWSSPLGPVGPTNGPTGPERGDGGEPLYLKSSQWSDPGGGGGGGGALTLVLGTHYKTDSRSCGCRLEKRGAVTGPRTLRKGAERGAFPVGAVVVSLASRRKASWISCNQCFGSS